MIVVHKNMKLTDALKASELLGAEVRYKGASDDVFIWHKGVDGFHFRLKCTNKTVQGALFKALKNVIKLKGADPKKIELHV